MKLLKILIAIAFLSGLTLSQTPGEKVQKMADLVMAAYNVKDYAAIEQQFNAQMKAAISGNKLKEFLDGTHKDFGKIVKLGVPKFVAPPVGVFPAEFEKAKMEMTIALDPEGKIGGLRISPPQQEKPRNTSRNKTALGLPFKGEWFVFWGGDTREQNYHVDAATQRFAFDIL